jgi:hypothetical protein
MFKDNYYIKLYHNLSGVFLNRTASRLPIRGEKVKNSAIFAYNPK